MYENEIYSGSEAEGRQSDPLGTFGGQYQDYRISSEPPKAEPKKDKKSGGGILKRAMIFACCGLCFGLFAGLGFYAVVQVTGAGQIQESPVQTTGGAAVAAPAEEQQPGISLVNVGETRVVTSDVSEMVEDVMPAMVSIINNYTETVTYWGRDYSQDGQASGSGIIIGENDKELLIATNYHVVSDANNLEVTFTDGSTAQAQIKGQDADMDLAVIALRLDSLSEETRQAITIARLGDSDALRLGEPVVAIGNALGYGQSMTGGYISALNREITLEDGSVGTFVQTDAAINPGNSGGALLNMNGEVIGINSNKIGGSTIEGMGFAIPISAAQPILENLMNRETRIKVADGNVGYMGVNLVTLTDEFSYMYGVPKGVFVRSVEPGSPAEEAGILSGDILTDFDGTPISNYEDLEKVLQYYAPGDSASLKIMRQMDGSYQSLKIEITLGTNPANQ